MLPISPIFWLRYFDCNILITPTSSSSQISKLNLIYINICYFISLCHIYICSHHQSEKTINICQHGGFRAQHRCLFIKADQLLPLLSASVSSSALRSLAPSSSLPLPSVPCALPKCSCVGNRQSIDGRLSIMDTTSIMDRKALCWSIWEHDLDFDAFDTPYLPSDPFIQALDSEVNNVRPRLNVEEVIWGQVLPRSSFKTKALNLNLLILELMALSSEDLPLQSSWRKPCIQWLLSSRGPTFWSKCGPTLHVWVTLRDLTESLL